MIRTLLKIGLLAFHLVRLPRLKTTFNGTNLKYVVFFWYQIFYSMYSKFVYITLKKLLCHAVTMNQNLRYREGAMYLDFTDNPTNY